MKTLKTSCFLLLISIGISSNLKSQTANNVGIGTTNPERSAILHLKSTNQGFLMTTLTTAQINSIITPTIGLITYNLDDNCYWYKHTIGWKRICNTDSLGNVFITSLTSNTINAQTVITNSLVSGSSSFTNVTSNSFTTNIMNFGNGYGDSIFVHYAQIDTAIIKYITTKTLKSDSIYLGGNSITTVITDSITKMAWLLKGNSGTNAVINFLGTTDNERLVIRTNNIEQVTITPFGEVGIGTNIPTNRLEVAGNTKSTNLQMTSGAADGLILTSDVLGNGSWLSLAAMVSTLVPSTFNSNAWTILGNAATNPTVNFIGTNDNTDFNVRTNNQEIISIKSNSMDEMIVGNDASNQISFGKGLNSFNGGMRYVGFNLKRNGTNFESKLFNSSNGSSFLYTVNDGEFGIGSTANTGLSPNIFTENQLVSNVRWRYTVNNQFLSVATSTLSNFVPTAGNGPLPQISVTGNEYTGLFITPSSKSVIGLLNNGNIFLQNDDKLNTIFHTTNTGNGGYEQPLINTNSYANHIFNTGVFINSNDNYSYNFNTLTDTYNSYCATYVKNNFGQYGFIIDNSERVFAMGGNGSITECSESMMVGTNNTFVGVGANSSKLLYTFGAENIVTAQQSMGLGFNLKVNHTAALCLGTNISSFGAFSVAMGAPGGVRIISNFANSSGVSLATGGGSWASISDRRLKENIIDISYKSVLDKIISVPVTEWNYLSQKVDTMNKYASEGIRYDKAPVHIGPMAQDFYDIFGYGEFKDKITSSDIDGVMFAGIKALAEENKILMEKVKEFEALRKEFDLLKQIINELKNK